ncbi:MULTISPECIES: phosphonate C-P lyase system protein PhnH [Rhizobium]|uniref:Phosphonate C-P lyase system protein PhnH n=1 Tax=Rhizobium rhododendri TaxID=2506430 RepID=A0ABY8IHB3_9HYPH|nr:MULTISPECIES: phosphonate C-P lyase system protein PhnH [Rhizobium]TQX86515.1 phosphonate C-P lyase system protein PhnH [Rhizobium sp. rho-13.1]TQY12289.1 phosphonate C-P lyase system protein PhnH [Rhizobium sp. rho-1.1]WFS22699.1 phosphonate C-P lyase system protein PhnH [Rhizobium rhododendri]
MSVNPDTFSGGFANPVFESQSVFKAIMDGMARPGTIQTIGPEIAPPAPLGIAAGAIALTLCDHETPVWLSASLAKSALPAWLAFNTGAALGDKLEARFVFLEDGTMLSSFSQFASGSQEYPDRSATIVLEVKALEGGRPLALSGPGIRDIATIAPIGLPESFLRLWNDNRAIFPRGADIVLTAGKHFVCLSRTTKITATEI